MTTITLEVPDEVAARLAALRNHLPELVSSVLDLSSTDDMSQERIAILFLLYIHLLRDRGLTADELRTLVDKIWAASSRLEDQTLLQPEAGNGASRRRERMAALQAARAIGDEIRARQEEEGIQDIDSVTLLDQLRAQRDYDIAGMR